MLLGTIAAQRRGTAVDRGLVGFSVFVSAIPYYVVALMAWIFISLKWKLIEDTTYHPLTEDPVAWATGLILPWAVHRPHLLHCLRPVLARPDDRDAGRGLRPHRGGQGVSPRGVVVEPRAARGDRARSSRSSASTSPPCSAGTVFTEQIFQIDGIGRWGINAIFSPADFPVVSATVLVAAVIIVLANLIVDLLYAVIDPRVRLG